MTEQEKKLDKILNQIIIQHQQEMELEELRSLFGEKNVTNRGATEEERERVNKVVRGIGPSKSFKEIIDSYLPTKDNQSNSKVTHFIKNYFELSIEIQIDSATISNMMEKKKDSIILDPKQYSLLYEQIIAIAFVLEMTEEDFEDFILYGRFVKGGISAKELKPVIKCLYEYIEINRKIKVKDKKIDLDSFIEVLWDDYNINLLIGKGIKGNKATKR